MFLLGLLLSFSLQGGQSTIVCSVTASGVPVPGAEIVVAGKTYLTDARGQVRIDVGPGPIELTVAQSRIRARDDDDDGGRGPATANRRSSSTRCPRWKKR